MCVQVRFSADAAWHETPATAAMDIQIYDASLHPRGIYVTLTQLRKQAVDLAYASKAHL